MKSMIEIKIKGKMIHTPVHKILVEEEDRVEGLEEEITR